MKSFDVIVIGAGIAGLSAGGALAEAGRHVLLVEARNRVGGRLATMHHGSATVELGAEFVHGNPPELLQLIAEAGLNLRPRSGDFLTRTAAGALQTMADWDSEDDPLETLKTFAGPDCSFVDYLDRTAMSAEERQRRLWYVEGFNAADATQASAMALGRQQQAEDEIGGGESSVLIEGYQRLAEFVSEKFTSAGGELLLLTEIVAVKWDVVAGVTVHAKGGKVYPAKQCVVALPLGVLISESVQFQPPIDKTLAAAGKLGIGHVCRLTCAFNRRLWPDNTAFLTTPNLLPSVWWPGPAEYCTLTGWTGGPRALPLLNLQPEELKKHALTSAALALGLSVEEVSDALVGFYTHNWDSDVFARGAYTWVPVGGLEASAKMAAPLRNTLFFAGEHTDTTGHWGTVHAALRSGLRAAGQILTGNS